MNVVRASILVIAVAAYVAFYSTATAQQTGEASTSPVLPELLNKDIAEKTKVGDDLFWNGIHKNDDQMALEGVKLLEEAAKAENAEAEYDLYFVYGGNIGYARELAPVKTDYPRALELLKKAAFAGYVRAENDLGTAYTDSDLGITKNGFLAYMWHSRAARQGYKDAKDWMKDMEELMTPDEIIRARQYTNLWVPEQSQPKELDVHFSIDNPHSDTAEPLLRRAADAGNTDAELRLGYSYIEKNMGQRDVNKKEIEDGLRIIEKAANAGNANAAEQLVFEYGGINNVLADPAKVQKWQKIYDKLQARDADIDYNNLTFIGTEKTRLGDASNLVKQWEKNAQDHDNTAEFNLGVAYLKGIGVKADPIQSYMWFTIAVHDGYTLALDAMSSVGATLDQEKKAMDLMQEWEQDHPK